MRSWELQSDSELTTETGAVQLGNGHVMLTTIIGIGKSIQDEWIELGRRMFGNIFSVP